ncbi:MAG: phosphoribosylglycinamide formyltransferase [Prevotella sp.]|nr:phosphoribosylglycinamide formyltransferase [Prevotella sp.]
MVRLAIFVSGSGTNCENIIRTFRDDKEVNVSLVVSNRADAFALQRVAKYGVPSKVLTKQEFNDEQTIMSLLKENHIDYIILAGFLLLIPTFLIKQFDHRIINIHPALLPKFGGKGMYGHHVHEAVKVAGETETGITIHYVNETYDSGDIIAQFKTPVSPEDTPETIAEKVHELEQKYFPQVIRESLLLSCR